MHGVSVALTIQHSLHHSLNVVDHLIWKQLKSFEQKNAQILGSQPNDLMNSAKTENTHRSHMVLPV